MKKAATAAIILFIIALSFWAGRRTGNDRSLNPRTRSEPARVVTTDQNQQDSEESFVPGTVKISPARQQLIGVQVTTVGKKAMTYTLRLYGKVVPDEKKIYRVNSSTDCWIRDLSDVTTGSIVTKDQILAEALAPAYYNAQATYLIALDNIDRIKQQLGGQTRHQQADLANNQIRMAVQALQNLGITDAQTEELANTRKARPYLQVRSPASGVVLSRKVTLNQWFKAAEEFYTIADISKVWVYADVYEDEGTRLRPGMTVAVRQGQTGRTFRAQVGKVLPLFDPGTRTLKVRVDVENPRYDLRPDMFVDVEIPITMPASVNVPSGAVLDSGTRAIIFVDAGNGVFEPRRVKTGWRLGGRVEITSGLRPGEKVVVSGNFLIDSESRMEAIASGMETGVNEKLAPGGQAREKTSQKKEGRAIMPGTDRSWADMLNSDKRSRGAEEKGLQSEKQAKDSGSKYPTTPEIVDWKGPDNEGAPAQKWEKGWGGFPGAKYLGTQPEVSKDASGAGMPSGPSKTGAKSQEEELKELERELESSKPQPSAQPHPPAK